MAVGAVVALNITAALVGVFFDDGIYLALARSLAEGHGYRLLYLPGQPAAVHYPLLYPLFLAGLWKLAPAFPANVALFKAANAVLMGLFAGLLVLYLRRSLGGRTWAWAALVAVSATVLPLVIIGTVLLSEPLFLVLLVATCWVGDLAREAGTRRRAMLLAALGGALAGAAALTRSLGIVLVAGLPVALALARRPRAAMVALLAGALCLAPWLAWVARHQAQVDPALVANYGTYTGLLAQAGWASLSPTNLADLARPLGAVALAPYHGWLRFYLGVPALVLLAAGFVPLLLRAPAMGWSLLGYLAVIALWPVRPDRFLWAVWPLLAVVFALGTARMWRHVSSFAPAVDADAGRDRAAGAKEADAGKRASSGAVDADAGRDRAAGAKEADAGKRASSGAVARLGRALVAATVAVVVAGYGYYQVRGYRRGDATRLQDTISAELAAELPWIRQDTPASAVIATEDEAHVWLYTGRRAVPSYVWRYRGRDMVSLGADSVRAWLLRSGATYVVLSGTTSQAAEPIARLIGRYPGFLRMVRAWPGSALAFAVERDAGRDDAGGAKRADAVEPTSSGAVDRPDSAAGVAGVPAGKGRR